MRLAAVVLAALAIPAPASARTPFLTTSRAKQAMTHPGVRYFTGCHRLARNAVTCKVHEVITLPEEQLTGWLLRSAFLCGRHVYVYITDENMSCREARTELHPKIVWPEGEPEF